MGTRERLGTPLRGHGAEVLDVAYDRGGTQLASAGGDGTVRLWDVTRHRLLAVLGNRGRAVPRRRPPPRLDSARK